MFHPEEVCLRTTNVTKDEMQVHLWNVTVMYKPVLFWRFAKKQNLEEISQGMWWIFNFYPNSRNAAWCIWKETIIYHHTEKLVSLTDRFAFYFFINSLTDNVFFGVFYSFYLGRGFFSIEKNCHHRNQILPKRIGDWNDFDMVK